MGHVRGEVQRLDAAAGAEVERSGDRVAFAFIMNYVYTPSARRLQDRMTAALARYDG